MRWQQKNKMKKSNYKYFLIVGIIGILYLIVFLKYKIGIPCLFHEVTGLYCPGCGMTRAMISIIKLDFYQASRFNILIFIVIPFFIIYFILKDKKTIPNWIWYVLLSLVILYGILRNIPAFSYLAPTYIV